jgi:hypothetical protein
MPAGKKNEQRSGNPNAQVQGNTHGHDRTYRYLSSMEQTGSSLIRLDRLPSFMAADVVFLMFYI